MVARVSFRAMRVWTRALGGASCRGMGAPPPCQPPACAPPPPCRAHKEPSLQVEHHVCRPPSPLAPPPCVLAATTIKCGDVKHQSEAVSSVSRSSASLADVELQAVSAACALGSLDVVARRLQVAAHVRRRAYEREVAARARRPPPPPCTTPRPPYAVGADRELARATDGRLYVLHRECPPHAAQASECRVKLEAPQPACQIRSGDVDVCAHQPRVFVDIERAEGPHDTTTCAPEPPPEPSAAPLQPPDWCGKLLPAPLAPRPCRPLSVTERLRALRSQQTRPVRVSVHVERDETIPCYKPNDNSDPKASASQQKECPPRVCPPRPSGDSC